MQVEFTDYAGYEFLPISVFSNNHGFLKGHSLFCQVFSLAFTYFYSNAFNYKASAFLLLL